MDLYSRSDERNGPNGICQQTWKYCFMFAFTLLFDIQYRYILNEPINNTIFICD